MFMNNVHLFYDPFFSPCDATGEDGAGQYETFAQLLLVQQLA